MEALAGTGVESYASFVRQARQYRREFIDFVQSEDSVDSDSLHIYGLNEGLSQQPVDPSKVPQFTEQRTYGDVLLFLGFLGVYGALLFALTYVSFLSASVRR